MDCPFKVSNFYILLFKFYIGYYAKFNEQSMLRTQTDFQHSCNLMELVATGTTNNISTNGTNTTITRDGVSYTKRELLLSVDFLSRIFMNIEQKKEYTGYIGLL